MTTASDIIRKLGLRPHPEGGCYLETYRADETLPQSALAARYCGGRNISTAIYYLIEQGNFSALHRVKSDELFHFYLGSPVEILVIEEGGPARTAFLGNDIAAGQTPQFLVPKNAVQGLRVAEGGDFALLGATVAPGFDFADFELVEALGLIERYPQFSELIAALNPLRR